MAANAKTLGAPGTARGAVVVGALGVVFGDIGTSPLYTVQTVFNPSDPHPVAVSTDSVFGIVSMIFWSVTIVVTVTYVLLVMRADNDGEGGIMALITLIRRQHTAGSRRTKLALAALGIFGASLFLGDSMITPAISVLSAVEGLKVAAPSLDHLVVPITAAIIVVLFLLQRIGTAAVGRLFGPVMIVWFLTIAACGVSGIAGHPEILKALSPTYALDFFFNHFSIAFFALAAVVLAVTGAEALYADMGHFGRAPITRAWLLLVFPACILSYMGQGALILDDRANITSPFFLLVPDWGRWPLVFLATAATVIASQAVITGAFSVAHQAVQLGYLPRLRIAHTSEETIGQIYVPWINWLLMVSVLTLVFTFETSAALAFAFGMAVTGTITITTLLFFYIVRHQWQKPLWLVAIGAGSLLTVDLLFLAANLTKLAHGAWLPLLIARERLHGAHHLAARPRARHRAGASTTRDRCARSSTTSTSARLRCSASPAPPCSSTAPRSPRRWRCAPASSTSTRCNEHVVILSIETLAGAARARRPTGSSIDDLGYTDDGITHATARFGYMDEPNVPEVLRQIATAEIESPLEVDDASYFLSTIDLCRGDAPGMSRWRKHLFLATSHITADAADYFGLPRERTVIMGSRIEV